MKDVVWLRISAWPGISMVRHVTSSCAFGCSKKSLVVVGEDVFSSWMGPSSEEPGTSMFTTLVSGSI